MNTRANHPASSLVSLAGRAAGFTLVELIVAVAAVALLTVGIGQIFSSVGRLVGAGNALAETDQFARSLEGQMRQDFAALSQLRTDETFLVIRNRRLGDLDRSLTVNGSEKAVYLNADDKEFDRKEGILPYAAKSKAITTRLDEMMFIADAGGDSATAQRIPPNMKQPGDADHVRLYYGHGLRPPIDRRFNPLEPPAGRTGNVPPRLFFADGDFGDRAGANNRFYPSAALAVFQQAQGRNEFAGDWLLLRQPLLLLRGPAAGTVGVPNPIAQPSEWMYSPFIRGLECRERVFSGWGGTGQMDDWSNAMPSLPGSNGPYARVLYHGRTDVCAQSLTEVKRWLEGLNPAMTDPNDASAFTDGLLDNHVDAKWDPGVDLYSTADTRADAPLWQRENMGSPETIQSNNHQHLISAVAGCLARFQAEDDPPLLERRDVLNSDVAAFPPQDAPRPRFQQVMDMHAVVASRVGNFEIAWTDGKTWLSDTFYDRNGDDDPTDTNRDGDYGLSDNLNRGDVIWYDMDFSRYNNPNAGARDLLAADTGDLHHTMGENGLIIPEVFPGERLARLYVTNAYPNRYDVRVTGADPSPEGDGEYLAVFPFRHVDQMGGYQTGAASEFSKPTRIRVRMTVYDAQFRLPGGRQYEFEFPIDLK